MSFVVRSLLLPLLACSLLAERLGFSAEVWTPIGPNAATVFSLVHDPFTPERFYVGTYFGGIYRTDDGGNSWFHLSSPFPNGVIFTIALSPSTPGRLFVGTLDSGTYSSPDGGKTWSAVTNGLPPVSIQSIVFDPANPTRMMAAAFQGVFRSADGGVTWSSSNGQLTNFPASTLLYHPTQQGTVLAGTTGFGVYRSNDSGTNWEPFSAGIESAIVNSFATRSGAVDIYASTTRGVYQLRPGSSVWRDLSFNLRGTNISQTLARPDGSTLAVSDQGIFLLDSLEKTNWTLWGNVPARQMVSGYVPGSYLVGALFNRLVVTYDQGKSFVPADNGVQNRFVGALATVNASGSTVIYAGTDLGVEFTSESFRQGAFLPWTEGARFPGGVFAVAPLGPSDDTLFAAVERNGVLKGTQYGRSWTPSSSGMVPKLIYALAEAPLASPKLYAGTTDGLYFSTNNGVSWLPDKSTRTPQVITSIAASKSRPSALFFSTADGLVYRSFDAGEVFQLSWRAPDGDTLSDIREAPFFSLYALGSEKVYVSTDDGLNFFPAPDIKERALSVATDPVRPWNAYVGTAFGGVYRTTNNAISWMKSTNGLSVPVVFSLAVDPQQSSNVYAGSVGTVFKSSDAGASWISRGTGLPGGSGNNVLRLSIDGNNPAEIFATVAGQGIYRTTNSGQTWKQFVPPDGLGDSPPLLVTEGTNRAVLLGTDGSGILRSADDGATWTNSSEGLSLFIRGLALDPVVRTRLYAGSLVDGIFKSSDGGASWQAKGLADRAIYGIAVDPVQTRNVYLATSSGVASSRDFGETWFDRGQQTAFVFDQLRDPDNATHFWIAGAQGDLFETADDGNSWTAATRGLPHVNLLSLAADWTNGILFVAAEKTGVFRSTNFGKSWLPAAPLPNGAAVLQVFVVPATGDLLAGTDNGGILLSTNHGVSWSSQVLPDRDQVSHFGYDPSRRALFAATSSGIARSLDFGRTWSDIGQRAAYILQMAVDPRNPKRVFVGSIGGQIYRTEDGGDEWVFAGRGLPPFSIFALAMDPRSEVLYASPERHGVWASVDGGQSWQSRAAVELEGAKIVSLSVHPVTGDLWASTDGRGLWVSHDAGSSWSKSGPAGYDQIFSVEFVTGQPGVIFAATAQGAVRSDDGGASWSELGQRVPSVAQVFTDPEEETLVFALSARGAPLRSADAGLHWTFITNGLPQDMAALSFEPQTHQLFSAGREQGVYVSRNHGEDWSRLDRSGLENTALAELTSEAIPGGSITLVGTTTEREIVISKDGGTNWTSAGQQLAGFEVSALAIVPARPGVVYAAASGQEGGAAQIYYSTNYGQQWVARSDTTLPSGILRLAIPSAAPDVLFALSPAAVLRSDDGGRSWRGLPVDPGPNELTALAVDTSGTRVLLGSTNGLLVSLDGGTRWTNAVAPFGKISVTSLSVSSARAFAGTLTNGVLWSTNLVTFAGGVDPALSAPVLFSVTTDDPDFGPLYALSADSLLRSDDQGVTWQRSNTGLTSQSLRSLLRDPEDSRRLYIGTADAGVFVSSDAGATWTHSGSEFGTLDAEHLAKAAGGALYVGSLGNGLLRSSDRGRTLVGGVLPQLVNPNLTSLTLDPRQPATIYGTIEPSGMVQSTNGGLTWRPMKALADVPLRSLVVSSDGLPEVIAIPYAGSLYRSLDSGTTWSALAALPNNVAIATVDIAGGKYYAGSLGAGLFTSRDQGRTWEGGAAPEIIKPVVLGVAVDPKSPNRVFAATSGSGVLVSEDYGLTWMASNDGLGDMILFSVLVDPVDPKIVYAASHGAGVYVSDDGGHSWRPLNDGLFIKTVTSLTVDVNDHRIVYAGTEGGGVFKLLRSQLSPALSITRESGAVTLSWPVSADKFVLEEAAVTGRPDAWVSANILPVRTNSVFRLSVPASAPARFFRLRSPTATQ